MTVPLYRWEDSALRAAFSQPEAQYAQFKLYAESGAQRRHADGMTRLDWLAQHGMVRQALERELLRDQCQILLLWYGNDELQAQRAGARLRMADLLQSEMPSCSLLFLFCHVVPSWCGNVPRGQLQEWHERTGVPYKTLAKQRVRAKCLLNQWLDDARYRANWVMVQRGWLQSDDDDGDVGALAGWFV